MAWSIEQLVQSATSLFVNQLVNKKIVAFSKIIIDG